MTACAAAVCFAFVEHVNKVSRLTAEIGVGEFRDFPIDRPSMRIGSSEGAEIRLTGDQEVVPNHARIESADGIDSIVAAHGKVSVNGAQVSQSRLSQGDRIAIGTSLLTYVNAGTAQWTPVWKVPNFEPTPVTEERPHATYLEDSNGFFRALTLGSNAVGRAQGCAVAIADNSVSRVHAEIVVSTQGAIVKDLGSQNGTYVNACKLDAACPLVDGDLLHFGGATFRYRSVRPD